MSRNLGVGRLLGLILLGVWGASGSWLLAQDAGPIDRGIAPATDQQNADQPRERVDRSGLTRPDLRANAADPSTGKPVDPQIEALLEEWSRRTKEINRLQGRHCRATRNFEWGTESWAEGKFYVETPDKGRIDLAPYSGKMPKTMRRPSPNGRLVEMQIQRDRKRDRWVCDGKEIKAIDDDNQTYEVVKIPPNQRGENIMDGPLPFLFGMPPERAKARYQFKLLGKDDKNYAIQVKPNWKQDAVDWTQAELLLARNTCLPVEVHLHNAAGTSETVYYFSDLQINKIHIFFFPDLFEPSLGNYKRSVHSVPGAAPGSAPGTVPVALSRMPSLLGMPYAPVKKKLETLGYSVELARGDAATSFQQQFHVQQQQPLPDTPLPPKSKIILTLYTKMAKPEEAPQQSSDPPASRSDYRTNNLDRTTAKPNDQ